MPLRFLPHFRRLKSICGLAQQLNDIDFLRNAIALAAENETEFYNNYADQAEAFR